MNSAVLEELQKTEIEWVEELGSVGLSIIQDGLHGEDADRLWIPATHVPAFIAAIQSVYAKR